MNMEASKARCWSASIVSLFAIASLSLASESRSVCTPCYNVAWYAHQAEPGEVRRPDRVRGDGEEPDGRESERELVGLREDALEHQQAGEQ